VDIWAVLMTGICTMLLFIPFIPGLRDISAPVPAAPPDLALLVPLRPRPRAASRPGRAGGTGRPRSRLLTACLTAGRHWLWPGYPEIMSELPVDGTPGVAGACAVPELAQST
jgi:hypothetical protein